MPGSPSTLTKAAEALLETIAIDSSANFRPPNVIFERKSLKYRVLSAGPIIQSFNDFVETI